ncbi:hypothetical protein V6N13_143288 [Hibiscus sabdariffa]|uniref:Cytochrome P450 n=1 Tax=Hibiscus sabdariffa TaxID=183260 RepID=A0ABR2FHF8_9ROSI
MEILAYLQFLILPTALLVVLLFYSSKNTKLPCNWPVLGMLPAVFSNSDRILDKSTEILESNGGTFLFKGPWFANMNILFTSNPADVHHIMSANYSAYIKGAEWKKKFDVFGGSLLKSDLDEWKNHRVFIRGFLSHQRFQQQMPKIFQDSMGELFQTLDRLSSQEVPVDFQHLLSKHVFHIACRMATGYDPSCFGIDSHESRFSGAISDAFEAIFARHIHPESVWRLQKWLGVGKEKKLKDAWITLDHLFSQYISLKQKELSNREPMEDVEVDFNALELQMIGNKAVEPMSISREVIRDNVLGIMFATHDTTSTALTWFFWLLTKHPEVEFKIRQEMKDRTAKSVTFDAEEMSKMVYLHAALCETLRLFPPVPFMERTPVHDDTLPCGHQTNNKMMVIISSYAMGRMASIWGEDCHEFKPERWINDDGGIKHEPPHKFFVFNTGQRVCLGKDFSFNVMKATAMAIIKKYDIKMVEPYSET